MSNSSKKNHNKALNNKRIVFVNTCLYGSTGRIVKELKDVVDANGYESWTISAFDKKNNNFNSHNIVVGSYFERYLHIFLSRITGLGGLYSVASTSVLLLKMRRIKPAIIHIHNLHNAYINFPLLFNYLNRNNIRIVWTFHDCWPITGRCPYFDLENCSRWQTGCHHCPFPNNEYPISYVDMSFVMWRIKRHYFTKPQQMVLVTPSNWLKQILENSFLKEYAKKVIYNGIDNSVFNPELSISDQFCIPHNKKILLGVALQWDRRKGLDVFIDLANRFDNTYQIVLVGIDDKQSAFLPKNIITINRTSSQKELAGLYSLADVFVNPTREDNFPTVNIEALASGTPIVCFDTGGNAEIVDTSCGIVVPKDDFDALVEAIITVSDHSDEYYDSCIKVADKFNYKNTFKEYIELYEDLLTSGDN